MEAIISSLVEKLSVDNQKLSDLVAQVKLEKNNAYSAFMEQIFHFLDAYNLLSISAEDGSISAHFNSDMLLDSDRYTVNKIDFAAAEVKIAEIHKVNFPKDLQEVGPKAYFFVPPQKHLLELSGGREGAELVLERARAFTHLVALNMYLRDFSSLQQMTSTKYQAKFSPDHFENSLAKKEKSVGKFNHFDLVHVRRLKNSKNPTAVTCFDMGLIKTPSGCMLYTQTFELKLVSEQGLFKLQSFDIYPNVG